MRFVGTGKSDGYGVLVTNIKLVHHNLVINGLFSYPVVSSNTGTTFSNGIVGWVGSTVQLGLSSLLNPNIDFFQALSGASVESYSTSIYCATANRQYSISLYWASQLTASLNEVAWKLVWNGQVMLSPTPADYACYFVQLTVSAMQGINTLQLQPQPMGSNLGPVFANVKIV